MPFTPEKITRDHVLKALEKIKNEKINLERSTVFDVIIDGQPYPPKEVMRYAHLLMDGQEKGKFIGGEPTNKWLKAMGFEIRTKNRATWNEAESQVPFFTKEDLEFYSNFIAKGASYRKDNPEDVKAGERIKLSIFKKSNLWGKSVCDELEGFEYEEDNRWNVSGNIKPYSWVRLFLKDHRDKKFFITLGVNAERAALVFKFDCQRGGDSRLEEPAIELFDKFATQKDRNWQEISKNEIEDYDWSSLVETTVSFVYEHLAEFKAIHDMSEVEYVPQVKKGHRQQAIELNTILYGPPGTGKTYNTVDLAMAIIDPMYHSGQQRSKTKEDFRKMCEGGRIVFTTFHQNMSYEDFIEGLKPQLPEKKGGAVVYDIEDGVFKLISDRARSNWEDSKDANKSKLNFEDAFEKFKEEWEENQQMTFPLKTKGYDYTIISFSKTSIHFRKASGGTGHTLSINTLKNLYYGQEYDFKQGVGIYYPAILNKLWSYKSIGGNSTASELLNYVIIIDEINRGNVSQIFGELITLIESDKRLGRDEALEITLPYSKDTFGVPPNLYIVGTMNTADRSVEALDSALRRRFSFEFMPPQPDVIKKDGKPITVDGVSLSDVLTTINERIAYLLDEDHQIGHAYFCNINQDDVNALRFVFKNKIIPLLREYFYNDHAKIRLVLGDDFVERKEDAPPFVVKDIDDMIMKRASYRIKPITDDFNIVSALNNMMGVKA